MSTLRLVLRRMRRQLPTMAAVVALIVITTVLLATLAQFTGATGDAAAETALAAWQHDGRTTLKVDAQPDAASRIPALAALDSDVAPLPGAGIETSQVSVSYALPGKTSGGDPPLMTFWAPTDLGTHAKLTAGTWPAAGSGASGPVQVAVPRSAADALKLSVGSKLTVSSRFTHTAVAVAVVGIYSPINTQDQYWRLDPLQGLGEHHPAAGTNGFDNYGPFAMDATAFDRAAAPVEYGSLHALVIPDVSHVRNAGLVPLSAAVTAVTTAIPADSRLGSGVQASSQLPTLIDGLRHNLSVIASSSLIPAIQLAVLALCALVMSAGLLQDFRATTVALMRARGAGAPTIAFQSAVEALISTVPAGLAAPWIAGRAVPHILKGAPAVPPSAGAWAAALGTAGICAATLVGSALKGSAGKGGFAEAQRSRGRPPRGRAVRRAALDLCAVGLGFVGYLELRRYGASGTSSGFGEGGVNAVLVLAPALALIAAALVAVRVVPLVGRLGDRTARRGPGFATPLGAWRAGRGGRIGTPALLLVAAIAMAVLTASYSASWTRAQRDQAAFSVGSDVRASGYATSGFVVAGQGGALPGAAAASLVSRDLAAAGSTKPMSVTVLGVEGDKAPAVLNLRRDLFDGSAATIPGLLDARRPAATGVALPGRPHFLHVKAKTTALADQGDVPILDMTFSVAGRLGPATTGTARIPMDGRVHDLTVDLGYAGEAAWPLKLTGITMAYDNPEFLLPSEYSQDPDQTYLPKSSTDIPSALDVDVLSLEAADSATAAPSAAAAPAADGWRLTATTDDPAVGGQPDAVTARSTAVPGEFLHVNGSIRPADAFQDSQFGRFGVRIDALTSVPFTGAVPVIASDSYLAATGQHIGDTALLSVTGTQPVQVHIVAAARALPTTRAGEPALLADNTTWRAATAAVHAEVTLGGDLEWWVRAQPGQADAVAAGLRAPGLAATVTASADVLDALVDNPVQSGIKVAFWLAAIAALTFAGIDFLVHLVGAVRERTTQNALVRALGASTRQVGVATAVELAFLVGVGLCFGVAVGELLAHLLVPAITVSPDGTPPAPPVLVSDPWIRVAELAAGAVAALVLAVAGVMSAGRRAAVGSSLRLGED